MLEGHKIDATLELNTTDTPRVRGYLVAADGEKSWAEAGLSTTVIEDVELDSDDLVSGQVVAYAIIWVDGSNTHQATSDDVNNGLAENVNDPVEDEETYSELSAIKGKFNVKVENAN